MKLNYLRNLSLQKKFIIVTYAAVIFIMVLVGFMITRRESAIMYRDIERQGKLLAETLAIPVMNDLIYERLGLVDGRSAGRLPGSPASLPEFPVVSRSLHLLRCCAARGRFH